MLNRFSHLGFVFFEDVNVDIRGDFSIAMTEVLGKFRVVNLLRKRYDFAFGKSYDMIARATSNCPKGYHNLASPIKTDNLPEGQS